MNFRNTFLLFLIALLSACKAERVYEFSPKEAYIEYGDKIDCVLKVNVNSDEIVHKKFYTKLKKYSDYEFVVITNTEHQSSEPTFYYYAVSYDACDLTITQLLDELKPLTQRHISTIDIKTYLLASYGLN